MGRKRRTADLYLFMNGQKVGTLTRTSTGVLEFSYSDAWLQSEHCRPLSLSMPLAKHTYAGELVENFFDNLLPDSQAIRNRIQTRFAAATSKSFDLLWQIGRDCVGALQLTPEDVAPDVRRILSRPLTDGQIADRLHNYRTMPLGMKVDEDFRLSIAGAQEKTALLKLDRQWHLPLGATPTSHIFKLPIGQSEHGGMDLSDSVENEWLCHLILKAFEIPVAHAEIAVFDEVKTLVIERFDRRWAKDHSWLMRLPQEDMCQALNVPSALKYESDGGPGIAEIMELLFGSASSLADRRIFMRLNLLFWLLAAIDGHAKNFSIFLLSGGSFQLTPAYDVMSAFPLVAKKQLELPKLKMAMSLTGKSRHYTWIHMLHRHWLSTAKMCRFSPDEMAADMSELLEKMDEVIERVADRLPATFPEAVAGPIFDGMRRAREKLARSYPGK